MRAWSSRSWSRLALIAAHAGARATLPVFMRRVPSARRDGLSADAGRPPPSSARMAALLGLVALVLGFGFGAALIAGAAARAVASALMAWLASGRSAGRPAMCSGALEQAGEILILLVAAAWLQA